MRIKSRSLVLMLLCTVFAGMGFAKSSSFVTITSSLNPSTYGSTVTFTAQVTPSAAMGTVTFMDGTTTLGTGTLSGGTATYTTSALAVGTHSITAVYAGNSTYDGSTSSPPLTQTVNKVDTSVMLTSNLNPSTYGSVVTFVATVTPSFATGTVTFMNGTTVLGTGTIHDTTADYTTDSTSSLAVGSQSITAQYNGDTNCNSSTSSPLTQTVNKAPLTVTAQNATRAYGAANPTFSDIITGFVNGDTQSVVSGTASLTTTATASSAPGTYPITAALGTLSAANYNFSTFVNGTLTITQATPTITWATPAAITYGTPLSATQLDATASVAGTFVYSPAAGTVLAAGTQTLSVTFTPTNTTDYTTATGTVQLTVNPVTTTVTLASSPNPSNYGSLVTFTAAVTPSTATGTVTFMDGGTTLGTGTISSGTATYSTSALAAGSNSITAIYSGDTNDSGSTSATLTQTVNSGPSITSLSPPSGAVYGTITINGSGFGATQYTGQGYSSVLFNGVGTDVQSWSNTAIQAYIPYTTSGPVTVTVSGVTSNGVEFTVEGPPAITSISPNVGTAGTAVMIYGSGFGSVQSDSTVVFNGVAAAVNSWSDTEIVAVVPVTTSGPVSVTVAGDTAQGPNFGVDNIVTLTNSLGYQTTYTTTMIGGVWVTVSVQGPGCSSCSIRNNMQYTYDGNGNMLTSIDADGNTITYTYDGNNNMLSKSAQLNGSAVSTSYTYNSFGEALTVTDPLGNTTTNTYDANGNLLTVSSPAPNSQTPASVTQFAYNNLGELTQITDPLNHITTLSYYSTGLIQSITDAQNNTTSYTYDARGNRTGVIDPINGSAHPTTFTYDIMNRLTGITYPDGTTGSFAYDYRGRRISATDQNGKTTTYAYDDADRLLSVTDPASDVTQYNYNTENNLLSITDANNHTTYFTYDAFGRVTQATFPSSLVETYGYDQLYNLTSKTDRKGQTIQYVYDSLYRLASKTYPDSTSANYVYDLAGKLQQVSDPTGTYGFAYDNMGRVIGTTTQYSFLPGHNFQNSYTYDAASNRTSLTAPDGSTNTYNYDTLNRLSTLTSSLTGQFGFGYDALSRRTQLTRPNGVNTNYGYDGLSHLLSVLHQAGSTTLDGASYGYDYAGNRTSKTNYLNGIASNDGYDSIYDLLQVTQGGGTTTESYSYDAVGNRLSSLGINQYSYNTSNELMSNSNGSYSYDNDGNTATDASGKSYTWDFENRMVSAVVPGAGTVAFKYDPFGRRVYKSSSSFTGIFVYDGDNLIETMTSSGAMVARYTQTQNIDEPLADLRSGGSSYYEADGLGSVTSLSSSAGTVADTYTYDSFGNATNSTGTVSNPFQYTGREFDSESSLYFYRARYYDPTCGRFLSEDPLQFAAGTNFYQYADNDPANLRDPSGKTVYDCTAPLAGFGPIFGPIAYYTLPFAGVPAYHNFLCVKIGNEIVCGGLTPGGDPWGSPGIPSNDTAGERGGGCAPIPSNDCIEQCVLKAIRNPDRPDYDWADGWRPLHKKKGENCQKWVSDTTSNCVKQCGGK